MTHEEAIKELKRCSGTQFDSNIVKIFSDCWETNIDKTKEDN